MPLFLDNLYPVCRQLAFGQKRFSQMLIVIATRLAILLSGAYKVKFVSTQSYELSLQL